MKVLPLLFSAALSLSPAYAQKWSHHDLLYIKDKDVYLQISLKDYIDNTLQFLVKHEAGFSYNCATLINPDLNIFLTAYHSVANALNGQPIKAFGNIDDEQKQFSLQILDYEIDKKNDIAVFISENPMTTKKQLDIESSYCYNEPKMSYYRRILGYDQTMQTLQTTPFFAIGASRYQFPLEQGMSGAAVLSERGKICGVISGYKVITRRGNSHRFTQIIASPKAIRKCVNTLIDKLSYSSRY